MAETTSIDVPMTDSTPTPSAKRKQKPSRGHEITSLTIKTPPFSYAYLELQSTSPTPQSLDETTVSIYLTSALRQFLGLSGTAISVDILKVEGTQCWVRIPRGDLSVFVAAVGGWVGDGVSWWVRGSGNWLSVLGGRKGEESVWSG